MRQALKLTKVSHQELAAPDPAVGPVTRSVPGHADDRPFTAVLRHTAGDVRVMVLDGDTGQTPPGIGRIGSRA